MPTFFDVIKKVLDRAYKDIDASDKDTKITEQLGALSKRYNDILVKGGPDYEDEVTRFAYVFRYSTAHAEYLNGAIGWSPDLRAALKREQIYITCIGGGPGSDVLGFVKFFLSNKDRPKLTYFVLDKEQGWVETWADVDAIVSDELQTSRNFITVDVTDKPAYEKLKKPFEADIFTLIYFLSEIFKFKKTAEPFFTHCFSKMKKGALFVVIDFRDDDLQGWIDSLAEDSGLETLETAETRTHMGSDEEKTVLADFIKKFGSPKLQASVMFRVYRKT